MGAGVAQVCERVQVTRMSSGFVAETECGAESDKKHDYGAISQGLHGFLEPFGRMNFLRDEPGFFAFDSAKF
jgi:hypothetical protein